MSRAFPGVEGELGELVVAAGLADQAHGVLAGAGGGPGWCVAGRNRCRSR
jgi:hypothetical protein